MYCCRQEMKVKPIRSLVYMFMVLERKERHNKSGVCRCLLWNGVMSFDSK